MAYDGYRWGYVSFAHFLLYLMNNFAFFFMKMMLWVLKESPRGPRGSNSNEHPQQKFLWRNVKNDLSVIIYAPLFCSSTLVVFFLSTVARFARYYRRCKGWQGARKTGHSR